MTSKPECHADPAASSRSRRGFLRTGFSAAAAGATGLWLPSCAQPVPATAPVPGPHNRPIEALDRVDATDGGADPFPIPWLDTNGNHNQMPNPGMDPSNIFHFKGRVARANDFTGVGTDNDGRRRAFGTKSTDFSFMNGEYFAGRAPREGMFGHI